MTTQVSIRNEFPKKTVVNERNTGYALDLLVENSAPLPPVALISISGIAKAGRIGRNSLGFSDRDKAGPVAPCLRGRPPGCSAFIFIVRIDESLRANLIRLTWVWTDCGVN